jgi:hypothetical protein
MNTRVFNAKILQVSASAALKDAVVARGLHLAFGAEDVIIDCDDIREKGIKPDDSEFGKVVARAFDTKCDYIHLF